MKITRVFEFSAAHHLPYYDGKCRNLHGHNYTLEVTIEGEVESDKKSTMCGMVMDFGLLKNLVQNTVLDAMDHSDLNEIIENPTAENIAIEILNRLDGFFAHRKGMKVYRIKLWEDSTSYVEVP